MFTPQELAQLAPLVQEKVLIDFEELGKRLNQAYRTLWERGINAIPPSTDKQRTKNNLKYDIREWQQVSENYDVFYDLGIGFMFFGTHPINNSDGTVSFVVEMWAYYGMAKVLVGSMPHTALPTAFGKFNDKALMAGFRYASKNMQLVNSYVNNSEEDAEYNPPVDIQKQRNTPEQEINQDDMPLSKENATDEANRVVRELVEKGLYPTEEDVKAQIKSYNLDKTTIRTINYYRQLQSRLEKDAKKNG